MRLMNDIVEAMIGLHCCGDVVGGVVEFFSIWRGRFSLTIPRINSVCGLVGFHITEIP